MNPTLNMDLAHNETNSLLQAGPLGHLREKLDNQQAVVCVVGLGYVGLPIAISYAGKGYQTRGVDLDIERILKLNSGVSCIQDVETADVKKAVDEDLFEAFDHFSPVAESDVIYICVPTPVTAHKDPDTSYITSATRSIAPHLRAGQLIILKSTTFPNTTEDLVLPILEDSAQKTGLVLGQDYALAFSPERVDPGNQQYSTENTPIVVGGVTPACTEIAALAVSKIVGEVFKVSSPRVAEMSKLLENIFRSVNIALANELARLCDRMGGLSMWEVVEAAKSKPFGFMPFYPGPGLGGHCIPIDPFYLTWKARQYGMSTRFIELAGEINTAMPEYVVAKVGEALNTGKKAINGSKILVLGLAYKKDVDDIRESPSIVLIEMLRRQGAPVDYNDPHVARTRKQRAHDLGMTSKVLSPAMLQRYDCVLIATDHSAYNYDEIVKHAQLVVDTRNATANVRTGRKKIVKA